MARKDFLTPAALGSGVTCRTLRMPDDKESLGVFNSALLTLLDTWRWEQVNPTDLTVDEAVAMCREVLNQFWSSSSCDIPLQPNGKPFIRYNEDGSTEQLGEAGWEDPTGEYEVPPVPPREGGTSEDQRCLAATNAAYVLELTYEQLTDWYGAGLSQAEAFSQFLLFIAALIAAAVAAWLAAIIALIGLAWGVVWETLEFIGADLWDANFSKALVCILYNCSMNDAGVVTFDYQCVLRELAANTDITGDLTASQLRLFGQLAYILQMIGGDGLNLAGATTAIETGDCSECDCEGEWVATYPAWAGWAFDTYGEYYVDVLQGTARGYVDPIGYTWENRGAVTMDAVYTIDWVEIDMDSNGVARAVALFDDLGNLLVSANPAAGRHTTRLTLPGGGYVSDHIDVVTQATNTINSFRATWVYSIRVHYRC